ncbi:hypothetical protein ACLOJK_036782 [Asimina triloba]
MERKEMVVATCVWEERRCDCEDDAGRWVRRCGCDRGLGRGKTRVWEDGRLANKGLKRGKTGVWEDCRSGGRRKEVWKEGRGKKEELTGAAVPERRTKAARI